MNSVAQPKSLQRSAGRVLFFGLAVAIFASVVPPLFAQALFNPALASDYRGDRNRVVVRAPFGELTESDLYLFLLMAKKENPDLLVLYREKPPGPEREAIWESLQATLREWSQAMVLSEEVPDEAIENPLDRMRLRFLLYPVHEMIWIDRLVRPQALVAHEDLQKYYTENKKSFSTPPTARVRYIFLKVASDPAGSPEKWAEARARIDDIQDSILLKSLTFEEAARKHSQAANAPEGGLTPEFERGAFFPAFEKEAFGLPPGNFSVLNGPDGVYLLQGEQTTPPGALPFEKVAAEIRQRLYLKQLATRTEQEVAELRKLRWPVNRAQVFHLLDPRVPIVKVGAFRLNRDMLLDLFPDLFADTFQPNAGRLSRALLNVETSELIAQDNERRGWDADVRMLPAALLARKILKGDKCARRLIRPYLVISRSQTRAYLQAFPEKFTDVLSPGGSLVQARLSGIREMGEGNRERKMKTIRDAMAESRDRYASVTLQAMAASWPVKEADPLNLIPTSIERELIRRVADDSAHIVRWDSTQPRRDLPPDARPAGEQLKSLVSAMTTETARFAPLIETEDSISLLYVEKPNYGIPSQADLNHFHLYQQIATIIEAWSLDALRHRIVEQRGPLELLFR